MHIYFNKLRIRVPDQPRWRRWAIGLKYSPLRAKLRYQTRANRLLPNTLIIGAQKCGTTSLFHYLAEHPSIFPSLFKEVGFFHYPKFVNGVDWYRSFFPLRHSVGQMANGAMPIVIEGTPTYLFDPQAASRVFVTLPGVRVIVLLRNPIERAYSHYQHMVRAGAEKRPFLNAIETEIENYADAYKKMIAEPTFYDHTLMRFSYLRGGHYATALGRWLSMFDRQQFIILDANAFYDQVDETLDKVYQFLAIPGSTRQTTSAPPARKKFHHHPYREMSPKATQFLQTHFEAENQALFQLIEQHFDW